ncbi:MAG TPA: hypothetical protein DEP36_14315 [Gammaproteobacteria bacterium]|nr:hypothetical protein [Gammaproteobacteria bacterium]HRF44168.1 (2Fe-2S)-binding protein [Candidatus Competibacteraceae bacterium]
MYLCICKSVSDQQIREAVELGARTIGDLNIRFGIGVECGKCTDSIREFLERHLATPSPASTANSAPPTVMEAVPLPHKSIEPAPERAWFAIDL